jgi:hypothetical protein
MDEQKIDLSVVDPSRDAARWERLVQSVARRAVAARRRRLTVGGQLLAWARPALAIAAGVALVSWVGSLASPEPDAPVAESQEDPAIVLARWASSDERPSATKILRVLGERHGID